MSDDRENAKAYPFYSALTEGELLALSLEQQSLTKSAQEALSAELRRRGLGGTAIAAFQRDAVGARARRARWRKVQRMRIRELFFVLLLFPGTLVIPLALAAALVFGLDPVLHDGLGLNQHRTNLCEQVVAIGIVVLCFVTVVAILMSDRSDATIRRWLPGTGRKPKSEEGKLRAHLRLCPARNLGNALLLLLFSLYVLFLSLRDVEGWSFLRERPSPISWSWVDTAGGIFAIGYCLYLAARAPCFREKFWFAFATANFVLDLPTHFLHTLGGRDLHLSRDISLILWACATIVALSLVKSAWQGHGHQARMM